MKAAISANFLTFILGVLVSVVPILQAAAKTNATAPAADLAMYRQKHLAQCGDSYLQRQTPQLMRKTDVELYYLCFEGFAVGYSGVSRTALWSAEHLTRARIKSAQQLERVNNFHEESRLPDRVKARLADYKNTPYDRGHLSPNGDMATPEQQYDSFSLANIVPQNPTQNRTTWRNLESQTRYLAIKYGEVYVVTGAAFEGSAVKQMRGRVLVPTHLFKAVYVPKLGQAGVYYAPNDDSQRVQIISLNDLTRRSGLNVMPHLSPNVQAQVLDLPLSQDGKQDDKPTNRKPPSNTGDHTGFDWQLLVHLISTIADWVQSLLKS